MESYDRPSHAKMTRHVTRWYFGAGDGAGNDYSSEHSVPSPLAVLLWSRVCRLKRRGIE